MIGTPAIINVMMAAKKRAARKLFRDYGEIQYLRSSKNPLVSFVKHAYIKSEEMVVSELKTARPGFGIKSKLSGMKQATDGQNYWVVNCLTGVENFAFGLPYFAISIAHEQDGQIVASVVDVVALGETYYAAKGHGSWVDRHNNFASDTLKMRVSANADLSKSLILTNSIETIEETSKFSVRVLGCDAVSLAYIAAAKGDAFIGKNVHYCDVAAGLLLIKEAGGIVADYKIDKSDSISNFIASNSEIAYKLG